MVSDACEVCGGKGFTIQVLNGKPKRNPCECRNVRDFKDRIKPKTINELELEEKIPNVFFRDVEFDEEELRETIIIPEHLQDIQIDSYIDFLQSYLRALRMGKIPEKSYYVVAPSGCGKKIFIYAAIKEAMRGGINPSGLIDTHDVYELMEARKYAKVKELLNVDVAFLTVGASPSQGDMIALRSVIDICERYGIPLVVISRFAVKYLARFDPMLKSDVGVFSTRKGDYGRLEHVGFSEELNFEYYKYMKNDDDKGTGMGNESVANYKERIRRGEG